MIPLSSVGGSLGAAQQTSSAQPEPLADRPSVIVFTNPFTGESTVTVSGLSSGESMICGYAQDANAPYNTSGVYFRLNPVTGTLVSTSNVFEPRDYRVVGSSTNAGGAYCIFTANVYQPTDPNSGFVITRTWPGDDIMWERRWINSNAERVKLTSSSSQDANNTIFGGVVGNSSAFIGRIQSNGTVDYIYNINIDATEVAVGQCLSGYFVVAKRTTGQLVFIFMDSFGTIYNQIETVALTDEEFSGLSMHIMNGTDNCVVSFRRFDGRFMMIRFDGNALVWSRYLDPQEWAFSYEPTRSQSLSGTGIIQMMFDLVDTSTNETMTYRIAVDVGEGAVYNDQIVELRKSLIFANQQLLGSTTTVPITGEDPIYWFASIVDGNGVGYLVSIPTDIVFDFSPYQVFEVDSAWVLMETDIVDTSTPTYTTSASTLTSTFEMFPWAGEPSIAIEANVLEYIPVG